MTDKQTVLEDPHKANDRIKRLKRRAGHLRERVDVRKESFDKAELSALDWAIDQLKNIDDDLREARREGAERLADSVRRRVQVEVSEHGTPYDKAYENALLQALEAIKEQSNG